MMTNTGNPFNKKFSFPINIQEFFVEKSCDIKWLEKYKTLINEVYISSDFMMLNFKDMNGENSHNYFDNTEVINFLYNVKKLDIKICVVFNDTELTESDRIKAFDALKLYEDLVDIIVVPNKKWLVESKRQFNFMVKNTVINLPTFEEIDNGDYDAYDMIYIHDEVIHNFDKYKNIKGFRKFGTVTNYVDCTTFCPYKLKHYNLVKKDNYDGNLFCPTTKYQPMELLMKRNSIPGFLSEYKKYLEVLDIFKLQGRNTAGNFKEAMVIIENIFLQNDIIDPDYLKLNEMTKIELLKWQLNIRNCGGMCEQCSYCDDLRINYEPL